MKHLFSLIVVLIILVMIGTLFSQANMSYKVIVNSDNSVSQLSKDKVSKLLLKKTTKWENGVKVEPVDLETDSNIRKSFTKTVHGKSVSAIKAYWQKKIFSGKGIPPAEKNSDSDVIAYVKAKPGAIGYVSANASTSGVKVVNVSN